MANLKDVIYLSNEDYNTLVTTGTVTISGDTLTYDDNTMYITPEQLASATKDGLMSAADKAKLDGLDPTMFAPIAHATTTTTYGIGTSTNYGHVKLGAAQQTGAAATDGVAAPNGHAHSAYIPYTDTLMPTNPFGGKKLYINSIDNAFAAADKKYWVTATKHKKVVNNVNYPYVDQSKAATDDNYFVDSPVIGTYSAADIASLFDGDYEHGIACFSDEYIKIRIMFGSNTSPSTTTSELAGYPYGSFYLSYYDQDVPTDHSHCHIYNKYSAHGLGWSDWTLADYTRSSNGVIESVYDYKHLSRTCVEFIIFGGTRSVTRLTQIDYKLDRPNLAHDGSTVTKYGTQQLYYDFEWWNNHTKQTTIHADGRATFGNEVVFQKDIVGQNTLVLYDDGDDPDGYRPNNSVYDGHDLDVLFYGTGITVMDCDAQQGQTYYQYSYPNKSGVFAMTSDIGLNVLDLRDL